MSSSTIYSVPSPFKDHLIQCPIEDWRADWKPDGKLVGDGLPVLRIFKENTQEFALARPYYLINASKEHLLDSVTSEKVIVFVSPLFDWKKMIMENNRFLEPVHKRPIMDRESDA
jgi:hypothetical protein